MFCYDSHALTRDKATLLIGACLRGALS